MHTPPITRRRLRTIILVMCFAPLTLLSAGCDSNNNAPLPIGEPEVSPADDIGPFSIGHYKLTFTNQHGLYGADIYFPADDQGNPDDSAGPYPIMTFSPGLGAVKEFNTWVGEHLSTHGYVVMVFSVPIPFIKYYNQQKDGLITGLQVLQEQGSDPDSPIFGMTDTSKRIIGGHSMGAMGSLVAASKTSDLSAVVALAPTELSSEELSGITAPTQIQGANEDCITRASGALGAYDNLPESISKQVLVINGGNHVGFNDAGSLAAIAGQLLVDCTATIDIQNHQQLLSRRYMTAWLNYHVKGQTDAYDTLYGGAAAVDLTNLFLTTNQSEP
ncbi:MAG: hypothetical protein VYA55_02435 [Pseudomonadota bacterium]|nr:hypothetical protein [Pseudomonadota bacterium]